MFDFIVHLLVLALIFGGLAASYNLTIGDTGLFSVHQAALFGIGAYSAAVVTTNGGRAFTGLLLALGLAGAIAIVATVPALRVRGDYLVVASFGTQVVLQSVFLNWDDVTGGAVGLSRVPPLDVGVYRFMTDLDYLLLMVPLSLVILLAFRNIDRSPLGRILRVVREDEALAASHGTNVKLVKVQTMVLSGAVAASLGFVYAHWLRYVGPGSFDVHQSIVLLTMIILGGMGTSVGPWVGAVALISLTESMRFLDLPLSLVGPFQQVLYGAALLGFLWLRPSGFVPERPGQSLGSERAPRRRARVRRADATDPSGRDELDTGMGTEHASPSGDLLDVVLSVKLVRKRFGGVHALDGVSFDVTQGQVVGIVGANGAGKTTLFNVIAGQLRADSGTVTFKDRRIDRAAPDAIARLGVARSFQEVRLANRLSALENVLTGIEGLGRERLWHAVTRARGETRQREAAAIRRAEAALHHVGLDDLSDRVARDLSHGQRKRVELARLMVQGGDFILLDEPAAGVNPAMLDVMERLIRDLRDAGNTILLIEHNIPFVEGLCDRVLAMSNGRVVAEGTPEEICRDASLLRKIYTGGESPGADLEDVAP